MKIYRISQDMHGAWKQASWLMVLEREVVRLHKLQQGISLVLVNAATSRRLNRHYRGKDYATDVLSFRLADNKQTPLLGELIFCYPVIARQAREHTHSLQKELAIMTIHGTLHLLGHDHEKRAEAKEMEMKERILLARLSTLR